jgi:tetratricopeptide (TPR) repeat protein
MPPPQEEALVRANTTFVYGEWQSAIDEYSAILVEQGNPAEPVQRIDRSVWQVFLPLASQFYDSTQSVEEIQKQQTGRLSLAHTGLGLVLELSNLPRKAIGEFEQAVKLEPGNLQAHYHLAKLYQKLGMDQEAQIHAQAAGPVFHSGQK